MATLNIDSQIFTQMISLGAENLKVHAKTVNELNVFPIPDGDTGDNMLMTMLGGASVSVDDNSSLSDAAGDISKGMLFSARGNSGVILSQFFAGIADGFKNLDTADIEQLKNAFLMGVDRAYKSVVTPTEGTMLTVVKDASYFCKNSRCNSIEEFMEDFIKEAKASLNRTPDLLYVLKDAGVVDSGGAGIVYIAEGMYSYLCGAVPEDSIEISGNNNLAINPELFTEDSEFLFGYCTELLLRLQNSKTDIKNFEVDVITEFLQTVGDSVVAVKTESLVKIHVHTMTPYKVLEFCQRYGEFLTVKIENMMLQHNEVSVNKEAEKERTDFAVVTVASGNGIKDAFINFGADEVISGGQTMNPSIEDFIGAFDRTNADTVFVLPNNSNIILSAKQAAELYKKSDVRVIPTRSIGDGYAVLSMLNLDLGDADSIEEDMNMAMEGVLTAEISKSIRKAELNGVAVKEGDYIAIIEKSIVSADKKLEETAFNTIENMSLSDHSLVIIIRGKDASRETSAKILEYININYPEIEAFETDGNQEIYDFIIVAE